MAVVIVLLLPVLFGFAGLAVDVGHMYVVKSQLKNAADAGALAGARGLVPYTATNLPDWANGTQRAQDAVARNYYENEKQPLTVSQAFPGSAPPLSGGPLISQATPCYWNIDSNTTKPASVSPNPRDVAAMHVQVSKTAGQNGGPVELYLASVLNVIPGVALKPADVSATSVAMISFPQGMGKGGLKPLVPTKAIVNKYWDLGVNFKFKIGDPKPGDTSIDDTMWSSFKVDDNSDAYTKKLINEGNPDPLYIGDIIHLQPGVRAVDYGPNQMGQFINQTVVLPIVEVGDLTKDVDAPILGFIAFHITGYDQGAHYIEGYFDKDYVITNPQSVGPPTPQTPSTSNAPQLVF